MSELEQPKRSQIGPEAFLSAEERKALQRSLSFPEDLPPKFRSWMIDFIAVNIPQISIRSIVGFERFVYNRGIIFPPDPTDGQMFGYQVDANTIWQFRFDNGIADAYKWIYTGGPPLSNTFPGSASTASTSFVDLNSGAPFVTVPRPGVYRVDFGAVQQNTASAIDFSGIHYGTAPADEDACSSKIAVGDAVSLARTVFHTVTSANQIIKHQYRVSAGTGSFNARWLAVTPIRLG